jgi:hypothetical protein
MVGLGKGVCGDRKALGKVAPHPHSLRPLTRKEKRNFLVHFTEDCTPVNFESAVSGLTGNRSYPNACFTVVWARPSF